MGNTQAHVKKKHRIKKKKGQLLPNRGKKEAQKIYTNKKYRIATTLKNKQKKHGFPSKEESEAIHKYKYKTMFALPEGNNSVLIKFFYF